VTDKNHFAFGNERIELGFAVGKDRVPSLQGIFLNDAEGHAVEIPAAHTPLLQVITVEHGPVLYAGQIADSALGKGFIYRGHSQDSSEGATRFKLDLVHPEAQLCAKLTFSFPSSAAAFRVEARLTNEGSSPINVLELSSFMLGLGYQPSLASVMIADCTWSGEFRWRTKQLKPEILPNNEVTLINKNSIPTNRNWRGGESVSSKGNLPTANHLPTGIIDIADGPAIVWEIESPTAWRYEFGELSNGFHLGTEGPSYLDGEWSTVLEPGGSCSAAPVSFAVAESAWQEAIGELTTHRRASRGITMIFIRYGEM